MGQNQHQFLAIDDKFFTGSFFAILPSMDCMHSFDLWNQRAEGEPYCVNKDVFFWSQAQKRVRCQFPL